MASCLSLADRELIEELVEKRSDKPLAKERSVCLNSERTDVGISADLETSGSSRVHARGACATPTSATVERRPYSFKHGEQHTRDAKLPW